MKLAISSELKQCQDLLESLHLKSQQPHLVFWSQVNPQLQTWNETAQGYLSSFDFMDKYQQATSGSPEAFLYSNSVESCLEFTQKYSAELKKHELIELGILILLFAFIAGFLAFMVRRKPKVVTALIFFMGLFAGPVGRAEIENSLRVYSYDALTGSRSFGEYLSNKFLEKHGVKVQFISFGTAGEALNQILLEGKKTKADLLMGLDEVLFRKAEKRQLFQSIDLSLFDGLEPQLKKRSTKEFIPFDYGYLSFVFDETRTSLPKEVSLKKFPGFLKANQKIVIQDPRTSSIGLEFLVWTFEKLVSGTGDFWSSLAPHILTISPGWSGAYELFLRKQADFVISYTTSPAYHRMKEKQFSIKPVIFDEGHFKQIEGIGILKTSSKKEIALKFIQFVLSEEAQIQLPTFQWMYPARAGTTLPAEFRDIPIPKEVEVDWERVIAKKDQWIRDWALILSQDRK